MSEKEKLILNVGFETSKKEIREIEKCFSPYIDIEFDAGRVRFSDDVLPLVIEFVVPAIVGGAFYDCLKSALTDLKSNFKNNTISREASITIRKRNIIYVMSKNDIIQLKGRVREQVKDLDELIKLLKKQPQKLIIFAGANGSGKTTVAKELLPLLGIAEFVNADEIARGLSPFNPAGQALAAGRLVIKRIDDLIAKGECFAIETTLSGHAQYKKLLKAKDAGYIIEMHYIFCRDIDINIERVKNRVLQGGHDVPVADIRRRYWRSLQNLLEPYANICDRLDVYDTSECSYKRILLRNEFGNIEVFDELLSKKFFDKLAEVEDEY